MTANRRRAPAARIVVGASTPGAPGAETPVTALSGIGPKRAAALAERGIISVLDLLLNLPIRYQDWRRRVPFAALEPGATVVIEGILDGVKERPMRGFRWRRLVTGWLSDESGARVRVVWFNLPGYMQGRLPIGERIAAYGKISLTADSVLELAHPEIERLGDGLARPLRPVYRVPEEVPQRLYSALVARTLERFGASVTGALPESMLKTADIRPLPRVLYELHAPAADANLEQLNDGRSDAHAALALDEMFAFQLAMLVEGARKARRRGPAFKAGRNLSDRLLATLPFALTRAQQIAIDEVGAELARNRQMNRLLMGDVGSGKTLVALWAALRAIESGYQAAMMAPTELLAEQHHRSFAQFCGAMGIRSALLTGHITGAQRAAILRAVSRGEIQMLFGTHALIQEGVKPARLGLTIVDEQHRFGVFERARLKALSPSAHMLLMTATPIPRSFAMLLFANLDLTMLDEMPPGRTPITTELFAESRLDEIERLVRGEIELGHRAYFVVPLIEGDEEDLPSIEAMAKRLRNGPLGRSRIGVLHGRLSAIDKQNVMRAFRDGALEVLISTTVVEVGIDVPEATVIVIVAAERYGLAQLHQLRGRVGRGTAASRCCLVISESAESAARARLELVAKSRNGEEVARADLQMRGPGDLLGARQSGALPLRFARFITDYSLIDRARRLAEDWLTRDPQLILEESAGCRSALARSLSEGFSLGDIG
ncbi:MAG TPA: ATP-dependent DNA helicase RecG [Candidatus Binataceae bacterium]|nr:ATP-dependent DNA helicase RecG [Candidatus Binataceae bacterium]